jgi:PII-like signaling protein
MSQCLMGIARTSQFADHLARSHFLCLFALERLRSENFAGAAVVHGVAGFGASSVIHTAALIELSANRPLIIEVVEDQPQLIDCYRSSTR